MKDKIYFPNLNGLRFFAALMVIISHTEQNKLYFGLKNNFDNVKQFGRLGVTLFFVLSGFLITFLLIKEKEKTKQINLKNFYIRRVLRIWPLYYFIVLLSLFVLPFIPLFHIPGLQLHFYNNFELLKVILLFVFFLPNLLVLIKLIPFATQTWSIGTEEQFYLLWPIIVNRIEKYQQWFIAIIVGYVLFAIVLSNPFFETIPYAVVAKKIIDVFQLDCLTVGALGAVWYNKKGRVLKIMTNSVFFISSFVLLILLIISRMGLWHFHSLIYAVLFLTLILNLVSNSFFSKLLENKFFSYLGKISYGLYMYHNLVLVLVINTLTRLGYFNSNLLFFIAFPIVVLVAGLSFKFLETPFLRKKGRFSIFTNEK